MNWVWSELHEAYVYTDTAGPKLYLRRFPSPRLRWGGLEGDKLPGWYMCSYKPAHYHWTKITDTDVTEDEAKAVAMMLWRMA